MGGIAKATFFISLLIFEHLSERFTLPQMKVMDFLKIIFSLRGLKVKFCGLWIRINFIGFFFRFEHLWMPFIVVLMQIYVVGESVKLFPLSSYLQWGGHVYYSYFPELHKYHVCCFLELYWSAVLGMGTFNSFTVTAFWPRQILLIFVSYSNKGMREAVTVCTRRCLSFLMLEVLSFQNKHHVCNASCSSSTNECVCF